jgi:hypothetical protein
MINIIYKRHNVICRKNGSVSIYICLERLIDRKFSVHQMEYLEYEAIKFPMVSLNIETSFLELFISDDPSDRCAWFDTIEEAIMVHDQAFSN